MRQQLTLYELNTLVKEVVETTLPNEYWVEAELSEVRQQSGHCYMELIQKDPFTNTPVAKAAAKCWRNTWALARPHFEHVTGQPLKAGMKVLLKVYAQFHENYGFSWIVTDIDPTYTMGDMARKRQEIIQQLKKQGVFDLNKQLPLPLFAQRIAVISSQQAAGYGDFCQQLANNQYGFQFEVMLFSAVMQGERVEQSIIHALDEINLYADHFDCVVIIRGGGATSDLSGFDTLPLAENVANFPLPVITGIGHDRDESVIDMVAHTRVKTPTAAAALLIDHLAQTLGRIDTATERICKNVDSRMTMEHLRIDRLARAIPVLFSLVKTRQEAHLDQLYTRLSTASQRQIDASSHHISLLQQQLKPLVTALLTGQQHRINMLQQQVEALDPTLLLKRGYSITLHNGKAVTQAKALQQGDEIETIMATGSIKSIVK